MSDINNLDLFARINFYERFRKLSLAYRAKDGLESYEFDVVNSIIKAVSPGVRYNRKEKCFCEDIKISGAHIGLRISLMYGIVECSMGVIIENMGVRTGGIFTRIARDLSSREGVGVGEDLGYPKFENYEDLDVIVRNIYDLFSDFIVEAKAEYGIAW